MQAQNVYRPEVDGLRALAVLAVIAFHANADWLSGGYLGVDVFFVISGYLITRLILHERDQRTFHLLDFYERRARRLLPALGVVCLAILPVAYFWLLPWHLHDTMQSLAATALFSSNVLFWMESGYFDLDAGLKPLLHTWSLAVEEQFYLVYPLLLLLLWRGGGRVLLGGLTFLLVASLILAQWCLDHDASFAFYMLPTRGWELLAGALTAIYLRRKSAPILSRGWREGLSLVGAALIAIAFLRFDASTPVPGLPTLVPVLGTCLVIVSGAPGVTVNALLTLRPLVYVGLISYSAYLWHQPIFALARHRALTPLSDAEMLTLSGMCLVLAGFTYRFIERPFREHRDVKRSQVFAASTVLLVGLTGVGVAGHLSAGFPKRMGPEIARIADFAEEHKVLRDDGGCNRARRQTDLAGCVRGADTPPTVALIGDSHASTLVHEMGLALAARGVSFIQYTKNGCPLSLRLKSTELRGCPAYINAVLDDIKARDVDTVVVAARWLLPLHEGDYSNGNGGVEDREGVDYTVEGLPYTANAARRHDAILESYIEGLRTLVGGQRRIVIIGAIPEQGWDVPTLFAKLKWFYDDTRALPPLSYARFAQRNARLDRRFRALARDDRVAYIEPAAALCAPAEDACYPVRDNQLLYYDDDHLSNAGARLVVAQFADLLSAWDANSSSMWQKTGEIIGTDGTIAR
ncbi:MAG: acyltransferase family protein [Pseudomonadota bacterium]